MDATKDGHSVIPLPSDDSITHNNNNNQPSEPVLNSGRSNGAQGIKEQDTAPGTSRRRSSSAGNKLRRRKAQFEVGDANHEEAHQEVQEHDRDTAGEETEGDEPHPHQQRQQQHGHSTRGRRTSATSSHACDTTTTPLTAAGMKDNGEEVEEDQARTLNSQSTMHHQATSIGRDEESLAKTLIDSTLTQSMRGLGLQNQLAQSEHPNGHEHTQGRKQEMPVIHEPVQPSDPDIAQQGHHSQGDQQHVHGQEPYEQNGSVHPPSNSQATAKGKDRDNSERAVGKERAGHVLEKSKSNPPEAVSNDEELSEAVHKSSASIHESQNLAGSLKPRHRALSRGSQKSKRMSMLLDPSTSTTSHPSLTKVTTHTVMAINPKQVAVVGTDPSSSSTGPAEVSHTQGLKTSSPTLQPSPAVELVSKFLNMGGAGTSTGHAAAEDEHPHSANGSPGSHRRSHRGGYDKSNATSPQQRAGYTSKFYPASPSQPQLSSSAPKISTMSNHLIPPTIVTTSIADEHLPDISATMAPHSSTGLVPAATGSAIAAAAVAQSSNGSKTGTLSRTQQKLWLQRENLQDVDEDEMARRGRLQKEIDRINREYKCVRMTLDPSVESILRCLTRSGKSPLQLQQQHQQQQQSSSQSSRPPSQHPPEKQSLQHHRSLQKLNGHYQSQAQQQQPHSQSQQLNPHPQQQQQQQSQQQQLHRSTQGHVGLGLQSTNQQSRGGAGGTATMGRDAGKVALRQMQQLRQPHPQQAHPQQQQQQPQYR
ncbi:hypothetical protein BGZ51_006605 [Haplosporangium sp. Z 767]|nr:hypothetical protein BGZ50_003034 [Haplosporangium sp. Z 11]KAF9191885.1 hypothetical protein BGZ51_006605 [Haplosporangium sp. Z 767]